MYISVFFRYFTSLVILIDSLASLTIVSSSASSSHEIFEPAEPDMNLRLSSSLDVTMKSYPYMVSIASRRKGTEDFPVHICGGALLAPNVVITVTHCFVDNKNCDYYVYPNYRNRAQPECDDQYYGIIAVHPYSYNFSQNSYTLVPDDVAIVHISGSIPIIRKGFNIVRLTSERYPPGTRLRVAGYGYTEAGPNIAQTLKEAEMVRQEDAACHVMHSQFVPEAMICALNERSAMVCHGDEGSPLVLKGTIPRNDILVGLVAIPEACDGFASPSYFINLYHYRRWILDKLHILSEKNCMSGKCSIAENP